MSISYLISCFRLLLLNNISKNFSSLITFSLFKINLFQRTTQHITITSICLANVHFFSTVTNKPWSAIYQYNEVFRISLGDTWFIYFFLSVLSSITCWGISLASPLKRYRLVVLTAKKSYLSSEREYCRGICGQGRLRSQTQLFHDYATIHYSSLFIN